MIIGDLMRSPILHALAMFSALFLVAFMFLPLRLVNDVLDSFVVAASISVLIRYARPALRGLRKGKPDAADMLIVASTGVVLGLGLLRIMRELGLDFGARRTPLSGYLFGGCTVLIVFSMFLKASAPPFRDGMYRLSPMKTVLMGVIGGTVLSAVILAIRWLQ